MSGFDGVHSVPLADPLLITFLISNQFRNKGPFRKRWGPGGLSLNLVHANCRASHTGDAIRVPCRVCCSCSCSCNCSWSSSSSSCNCSSSSGGYRCCRGGGGCCWCWWWWWWRCCRCCYHEVHSIPDFAQVTFPKTTRYGFWSWPAGAAAVGCRCRVSVQNASSGCCCQSAVCSLELACWYRVVLSKCGVCYQAWVLVLLQGVAGVYGSVDVVVSLWRLRLFRSKKGEYVVATKKYLLLSGVFAGVIFYICYIYIYIYIIYTCIYVYAHHNITKCFG